VVNALLPPPPPPPPPRSRDKPDASSRGWARPCQVRAKIHRSPKRGTAGVCRDRALAASPKTDTARVYCGEPSDSTPCCCHVGRQGSTAGVWLATTCLGLAAAANRQRRRPTTCPGTAHNHPRHHPSPGTIPDVITIAIAGVVTGTAANTPRREWDCHQDTHTRVPTPTQPVEAVVEQSNQSTPT